MKDKSADFYLFVLHRVQNQIPKNNLPIFLSAKLKMERTNDTQITNKHTFFSCLNQIAKTGCCVYINEGGWGTEGFDQMAMNKNKGGRNLRGSEYSPCPQQICVLNIFK